MKLPHQVGANNCPHIPIARASGTTIVDLKKRFDEAERESAEDNFLRFATYVGAGSGRFSEIRVLGLKHARRATVKSRYEDSLAALVEAAVDVATHRDPGIGTFLVMNELAPGCETRVTPHEWHVGSVVASDRDITHRWAFYVDCDAVRLSGISATDDEKDAAVAVGWEVADLFAQLLGDRATALGVGMSGNGAQVYLALDRLPSTPEVDRVVTSVLACAACLFSSDAVKIDESVANPARLAPAFGTRKMKGADTPERPHRKTCFSCFDEPHRLTLAELDDLAQTLLHELDLVDREKVQAILAKKYKTPKPAPAHSTAPAAPPRTTISRSAPSTPFEIANALPAHEVLAKLGLLENDRAVCPACRRADGSTVKELEQGVKCLHASCADHGKNGFFTNIDLVMEVNGCSATEALKYLDTEFDLGLSSTFSPSHTSSVTESSGTPWGPITPIQVQACPTTFPVHALPTWLASYVNALSVALQVPVDLPALLTLSVISLATAGKFVAQVRPDWREHLVLYVMAALETGNLKTPTFAAVTEPVRVFEARLRKQSAEARTKAEVQRERLEADLKAAKASAADGSGSWEEVERLANALKAVPLPPLSRRILGDITPEALGKVMAEHEEVLGLLSDEGGLVHNFLTRYADVPNIDLLLQSYVGNPVHVDRVQRGELFIRRALLVIALTVQPEILAGLGVPELRLRGFHARFCYTVPVSWLGQRNQEPPPVPDETATDYEQKILRLFDLPTKRDAEGHVVAEPLEFDRQARYVLAEYGAHLEPELPRDGELGQIQDWATRLRGRIVRLAALLHLAEFRPTNVISADLVDRAIEIGEYLLVHAEVAYAMMSPESTAAARVAAVIKSEALMAFSVRELFERVKGTVSTVYTLEAALAELEKRNIVRQLPTAPRRGPGRPKSPEFEVNPAFFGGGKAHRRVPPISPLSPSVAVRSSPPNPGEASPAPDGAARMPHTEPHATVKSDEVAETVPGTVSTHQPTGGPRRPATLSDRVTEQLEDLERRVTAGRRTKARRATRNVRN